MQGRLDLILITFDIISLIYVYGSRIYIVFKFMQNLTEMMPDIADTNSIFAFTNRIIFTVILNSFLFASMIALLGLQVYHENLPENKPAEVLQQEEETGEEKIIMTHVAAYMLITTLLVPILSIVVFALANYYYLLELMIKVNVQVLQSGDMREKIDEYGEVAQGIMGFAKKNVHATPGRLRDIQSLTTFQRVFYVLREWWIDLLFSVWSAILVLYSYFFYEYVSKDSVNGTFYLVYIATFVTCVSIFVFANYHTFLVVLVTNVIMVPLFLSYGLQTLSNKCKTLSNRAKVKQASQEMTSVASLIEKYDEEKGKKTPNSPSLSYTPAISVTKEDGLLPIPEYIPQTRTITSLGSNTPDQSESSSIPAENLPEADVN